MFIQIGPLIRNRSFRYLYIGQLVSTMGSMITYVALPYQIYHITHSSFAVGIMGTIELVPLLFTALLGGVYADSMDRRKLLIYSELGLALGTLLLVLNSMQTHPKVGLIYCIAGVMSAINGLHRPALESLTPRLVAKEEIPEIGSLMTLKGLLGTICGPALGGFLIPTCGLPITFAIDFLTFGISLLALLQIQTPSFQVKESLSPLKGIREGVQYAWSRPELMGSYLIDFVAMIFGMPMALFPAVSESLGGAKALGFLYAAPAIGATITTVLSGWTRKIRRSGAAISISAVVWGMGITAFGFSGHLYLALGFLVLAGAADAMSGIFRYSLWNQTIPDRLRGRLAGLEMISYMSGPLLGHTESGLMAAAFDSKVSVVSGGLLCILGVVLCVALLPRFWKYELSEGGKDGGPEGRPEGRSD